MAPLTRTFLAEVAALQQKARQYLRGHTELPRRYGTAFHVTPPADDVWQLLPRVANSGSSEGWGSLSSQDLRLFTEMDFHDVYLAGLWAYIERVPVRVIVANEGQALSAALDQPGLVLVLARGGSAIQIHHQLVSQEVAISRTLIWQAEGSSVTWLGLRAQNDFLNDGVRVHLTGAGATCTVTHLLFQAVSHQADVATQVYHEAPATQSRLAARAAAQGKARVVYRGLIDVAGEARGSQGYQALRGLLLSPTCVVDTLPELAIRTHDVQCSHGVVVSHCDKRVMLYLRSRGLSPEQARLLAILGFYQQGLALPEKVVTALTKIIEATA